MWVNAEIFVYNLLIISCFVRSGFLTKNGFLTKVSMVTPGTTQPVYFLYFDLGLSQKAFNFKFWMFGSRGIIISKQTILAKMPKMTFFLVDLKPF